MSLHSAPQGVALTIDSELRGVVALGALESAGLVSRTLPPAFAEERERAIEAAKRRAESAEFAELPGIADVRAMFHRLAVDPTKTRPSSEALFRRVLQGKGLPEIAPIVDVCNLCSFEFLLPLGLYDADHVQGAVTARIGGEDEGYDGIRKARVQLEGRLLLADGLGPFGAPTSDSLRTSIRPETSRVLVVVFCPPARASADLSRALESVADRLARHCGGELRSVRVLQ